MMLDLFRHRCQDLLTELDDLKGLAELSNSLEEI